MDEMLEVACMPLIEPNRRSHIDFLSRRKLWKTPSIRMVLHSHESGSNLWVDYGGGFLGYP